MYNNIYLKKNMRCNNNHKNAHDENDFGKINTEIKLGNTKKSKIIF